MRHLDEVNHPIPPLDLAYPTIPSSLLITGLFLPFASSTLPLPPSHHWTIPILPPCFVYHPTIPISLLYPSYPSMLTPQLTPGHYLRYQWVFPECSGCQETGVRQLYSTLVGMVECHVSFFWIKDFTSFCLRDCGW